jgi:acyl-homoserine-lactone acylase
MALSYTENGPEAEAFLTYGQSGDPASEHFIDQTRLFSNKAWRPVLFNDADIKANTQSTKTISALR